MRRPKTPRKRIRDSRQTEERVANRYGGRRTARSGAGFVKGDSRVPKEFRIENKETMGLTYRLHIDELDKLSNEALSAGEIPVMHIQLTDRRGRKKEFAVLRFEDHMAMVDQLREDDE